jgi:hypothetical protein
VIARREGIQMHNLLRYRNLDGNVGASITNRVWHEFDADACFVDATGGYGFPWIDALKTLGKAAIPIQFSNRASDPERYVNRRAEMYFRASSGSRRAARCRRRRARAPASCWRR